MIKTIIAICIISVFGSCSSTSETVTTKKEVVEKKEAPKAPTRINNYPVK